MVKFQVHTNPQGQVYLPVEVRKELGEKLTLVCNTRTAVIFNAQTPLNQVLDSLAVVTHDLKNRQQIESASYGR
jgi:bifunctional DNA-binding transcriptional regulator/antitoxin component of YhaV-PrlF toxin-antitoxin module